MKTITEMTATIAGFARRISRFGNRASAAPVPAGASRDMKNDQRPRNTRNVTVPIRAEREEISTGFAQVDGYPEMFRSIGNPALPVLVCAGDPRQMGDVVGWFRAQGIAVSVADNLDCAQVALAGAPQQWSYVFVDGDSFDGTAEWRDRLLALRRNAPSIPVVLISRDFLFDDFTCECLPLADVSLQAPVTYSALELSLLIAQQNNTSWQVRLKAG